jgi:hypothetical protein
MLGFLFRDVLPTKQSIGVHWMANRSDFFGVHPISNGVR